MRVRRGLRRYTRYAVLIAVVPLAGEARQKPGSVQDVAAVAQRKVV